MCTARYPLYVIIVTPNVRSVVAATHTSRTITAVEFTGRAGSKIHKSPKRTNIYIYVYAAVIVNTRFKRFVCVVFTRRISFTSVHVHIYTRVCVYVVSLVGTMYEQTAAIDTRITHLIDDGLFHTVFVVSRFLHVYSRPLFRRPTRATGRLRARVKHTHERIVVVII